ncbi:MAG: glycosyltransferase family 9 protein [Kiritimatiellae bacterium]|nr:glycosyltransferase family 9 protein [Kiritimatiellia bacterium]
MNTGLMRRLDSLLGLPLAWALGLVPRRRRELPAAPGHVVVVKFFGLGSIVLAAAALRALTRGKPGVRLSLVTFANHADIEPMLGLFHDVLTVRTDTVGHVVRDTLRLRASLRRLRPDVVVDIEYFSKLATVLCATLGARFHLGFHLPARWRERLIDGGIAFREDIHFSECIARLLHPWGVDYHDDAPFRLDVPDPARHEADALLRECARCESGAPLPAPCILVNPNAHDLCAERRWPAASFSALLAELADAFPNGLLLLIGAPAEAPYTEAVREAVPPAARARVHNLAGRTPLPLLAALLQRAHLLVTNDSGTLHLGAAAGAPLVALFGPESPLRYGPRADPARCRVIHADVVCGPCLTYMNHKRAPCAGENVCMQSISVPQVMQACRDLLARPNAAAPAGRARAESRP